MTRRVARKMRVVRARRHRKRGVALILVLAALTVLTVMLTEIQDESSAEFGSALAARDSLIAEYAAKSGVNLSRLLIAAEPTIRRSLTFILSAFGGSRQIPVWQYADQILGAFNNADGASSFASLTGTDPSLGKNLGFPGAGFRLDIVDEDSKINVNAAAHGDSIHQLSEARLILGQISPPQYNPLFEGKDGDGLYSDRRAICSAIIDWVDPDQDQAQCDPTSTTAQQASAEDSFYQLLKKPYLRKNAAFDSLQELHRVRGISDDFWATFVDPDPDKPDKRVVTVWGQDKINVNTANPQTLLAIVCQASNNTALVCQDANEAQKFLMAIGLLRNFMPGLPVFASTKQFVSTLQQAGAAATTSSQNSASGMAGLMGGGSPVAMIMKAMGLQPIPILSPAQTEQTITTESKVFSIYSTGYVHSGKRESTVRIHAVVDFRGAPTPDDIANQIKQLLNPNGSNASGAQQQTPPPIPAGQGAAGISGQTSISGALKPGSGGNVIYYRVD